MEMVMLMLENGSITSPEDEMLAAQYDNDLYTFVAMRRRLEREDRARDFKALLYPLIAVIVVVAVGTMFIYSI